MARAQPERMSAYIPETRSDFVFRRYYRHRLAGPYRIYQQHGDASFSLLHTPLHNHSGLYRAVADQQDMMQTRCVIEAIGVLYFDACENRAKPAATGAGEVHCTGSRKWCGNLM